RLLVLAICGCGGQDATMISIFPSQVYTAVEDTGARYSVPVAATGAGAANWSTSDSSVAAVSGTDVLGQIVAAGPGATSVEVVGGARSATAGVTVVRYQTSDRMAGEQKYAAFMCAGCHGSGTPDITPSGIGKHTDEQIQAAITQGLNPEGG